MRYVEVIVKGLALDPSAKVPILLLEDVGERVMLPIWIGASEANAIASALEGVRAPRPMTHDLLKRVVVGLHGEVVRVDVRALKEGTFYADLILADEQGGLRRIDCRPSDAIALAVRTGAPIRVALPVLEAAQTVAREAPPPPPLDAPQAMADDADGRDRLAAWLADIDPAALGKYKM